MRSAGGQASAALRAAVDADLAVAMVNPGEERAYLAAGFVPTPRTIHFIGKRLTDDAAALAEDTRCRGGSVSATWTSS